MIDSVGRSGLLTPNRGERVICAQDEDARLRAFIAIHDTTRGPAFGGCRLWRYGSESAAIEDACRLAEGMTLKNALAELPFGGGKAVILFPERLWDRRALFRAFGREVDRLQGRYITAEDVGTTSEDMRAVLGATRFVSGIPRPGTFGGDPSGYTAQGVFESIRAAARSILRRKDLKGLTVAVQGAGAVGSHLCAALVLAGAKVCVADVNSAKCDVLREIWGVRVEAVDSILSLDVDVFAPCALGGVLTLESIRKLKAPIIAGAANNQLLDMEVGDRLHEIGTWYLPDFLVNAGGIIAVSHEYLGTREVGPVLEAVGKIGERAERLIEEVWKRDEPPARVAVEWARERLGR